MSDKDRKSDRRRRSFKDINRDYDFIDKGVEGLEEEKRRRKQGKPGGKRRSSKRPRPKKEDLGETMRLTPEMIERERRRIEQKRREERRKKNKRKRILIGAGIIVLLLLIFWLIRSIGNSGEEEAEPAQGEQEVQEEAQKPEINETTGRLQKFSRTNKVTSIYKDATENSEEIKILEKDRYVENYGVNGDYTKIFIDGKTGYVPTVDLSDIEDENMFKVEKGLLIVNDDYYLPSDYNPGQDQDARKAFEIMVENAEKEGIRLKAVADQRSFEQQKILYEQTVQEMGAEEAGRRVAVPGHSEAQAGLQYEIMGEDYDKKASEEFDNTEEARWLKDNAYKYGFILRFPQGKENITGRVYRSWIYRYVGVDAAKEIHEKNLTLEEYVGLAEAPKEENGDGELYDETEGQTDSENTDGEESYDEENTGGEENTEENGYEDNGYDEENDNTGDESTEEYYDDESSGEYNNEENYDDENGEEYQDENNVDGE